MYFWRVNVSFPGGEGKEVSKCSLIRLTLWVKESYFFLAAFLASSPGTFGDSSSMRILPYLMPGDEIPMPESP